MKTVNIDILEGRAPIPESQNGIEPVNEYLLHFKASILDQTKDYPAPVAIMNIIQGDETLPLLTLKSFSLWQGKQKSKKTTLLAITIAAFIADYSMNTENNDCTYLQRAESGLALWFDTEQGQSYAARTMKLILKLANREHSPNLIYSDIREHSPRDRFNIIKEAIANTSDLKIMIIDGLVDLMDDFMDAKEGHNLITELIKMCSQYNVHIAGVLHQNKSKEDRSARAHVGSIASQKCEIEISASADAKDLSISTIECFNARGIPFKKFTIRWQKGKLPEIANMGNDIQKPSKAFTQGVEIRDAVFKSFLEFSRTEAELAVMNLLKASESTAKRRISEMISWGLIEKGEDGRYRGVRVQEGSDEGL